MYINNNKMTEVFKACIENYEVSNFGNIRRKIDDENYRYINCSIQNRGYKYFQLKRNGKRLNYLVHQLVAKCFIGERPNGLVIDHIDRNKLNNDVSNLRYITQGDNCKNQDRYIVDIKEIEPIERRKQIVKRYRALNKDKLLKKKKEYYLKNKTQILAKSKQKEPVNVICSLCKTERKVSHIMFQSIKRKGIDKNICRKCSCKKNIEVVNLVN